MDREQERTLEKRRKRKKKIIKRRIFVGFLTFLIISLIALVVLCFTVLFPVKEVAISGSKLYSAEKILEASEITNETNLLIISEERLTEKIREKLTFIDSIKIKRELPNKLYIVAKDAKEYAVFSVENDYYTVSKKGYVLNKYSEKPAEVFEIFVSKVVLKPGERVVIEDEPCRTSLISLGEALIDEEIKIDYIDVTDSLTLKAKVEGRFEVNFGTAFNLDKKVAHLKGMILKIGKEKTGKINLSMWSSEKTEGSFVEGDIK